MSPIDVDQDEQIHVHRPQLIFSSGFERCLVGGAAVPSPRPTNRKGGRTAFAVDTHTMLSTASQQLIDFLMA
jgi:hypothetical protein